MGQVTIESVAQERDKFKVLSEMTLRSVMELRAENAKLVEENKELIRKLVQIRATALNASTTTPQRHPCHNLFGDELIPMINPELNNVFESLDTPNEDSEVSQKVLSVFDHIVKQTSPTSWYRVSFKTHPGREWYIRRPTSANGVFKMAVLCRRCAKPTYIAMNLHRRPGTNKVRWNTDPIYNHANVHGFTKKRKIDS